MKLGVKWELWIRKIKSLFFQSIFNMEHFKQMMKIPNTNSPQHETRINEWIKRYIHKTWSCGITQLYWKLKKKNAKGIVLAPLKKTFKKLWYNYDSRYSIKRFWIIYDDTIIYFSSSSFALCNEISSFSSGTG